MRFPHSTEHYSKITGRLQSYTFDDHVIGFGSITFFAIGSYQKGIGNDYLFQEERNFKGVMIDGCIDCTHVAIVRSKEHEEMYANHKGFYSINAQAVAFHDLEILNINIRFPGTVHDAFI